MPKIEILDYTDTPLGVLCLRRRELLSKPGETVTEVTLDHEFLMSSYYTESERALATRAIEWHGASDLRVLVGGLGLGYSAHAALQTGKAGEVVVFEVLAPVIRWLASGLIPLSDELRNDPRFKVEQGDLFARLRGEPPVELFDAILIDIDHSPDEVLDPTSRPFYSPDGLRCAAAWLAPGGVIAVWSSAEDAAFVRALEETFEDVRLERVEWHNDLIDRDQVDELFLARGVRSD